MLPQSGSSPPGTENQTGGGAEIKVEVRLSDIDWDAEEEEDGESTPAGDLQNINWDEEDPVETIEDTAGTPASDLQNINWDEGGDPEETPADFIPSPPSREAREELTEGRILFIHWSGALLFLLYLTGSLGSGYFLRNSTLSARCPPDLLILLRIFWPLEWALQPFFRKKKNQQLKLNNNDASCRT